VKENRRWVAYVPQREAVDWRKGGKATLNWFPEEKRTQMAEIIRGQGLHAFP